MPEPTQTQQTQQTQTQQPAQQQTQQTQTQTVPTIDYDRIKQMIDGTLAAKEDTALKAYFKQQGLSQQEAEQAIATFKEQKAKSQPNVEVLQQQTTQAQQQAQQAQQALIERDAYKLSGELGIDLKTMDYVLKMVTIQHILMENLEQKQRLQFMSSKVVLVLHRIKRQDLLHLKSYAHKRKASSITWLRVQIFTSIFILS